MADYTGRFIYVRVALGKNVHEVLTSSPLYLQEARFFSDDEFAAAYGGFEGDGRLKCSYKNPGNDQQKNLYNNCFCKVWMQVENTYQRVGAWFPLLGMNKKKLPYSEQVLQLAIHAAMWLNNWIIDSEDQSYSVFESSEMLYRHYYA